MKMPANIVPMAATKPFNDVHWFFELKLDGYRILAYINEGNIKLQTRNLVDYTAKFPQIVSALQKWKRSAIIDGEVVMLNEKGKSDFEALQAWRSDEDGPLYYFVFDLLWLDGKDLMKQPLSRRKSVLKSILPRSHIVIYQSEIMTYGVAAYKMAQGEDLEGVVAKKVDSIYVPGTRSKDWLKLKVMNEADFIICGYTRNLGAGPLSTLILGAYNEEKLQFVGEVGTGFTFKVMNEIIGKLKPLKKCPFPKEPRFTSRWRKKKPDEIFWCKPQLVCEVRYFEVTKAGELRHPSFRKLLPEKSPNEVLL